jgi:hypothetical protein
VSPSPRTFGESRRRGKDIATRPDNAVSSPVTANLACLVPFLWPKFGLTLRSVLPSALGLLEFSKKEGDAYNVLWALVFGFATLNILGLAFKRLEPSHSRLNFGEMLAIMVVLASVILLGYEMLYMFKVLPIKLGPR